MAYDWSHLEKLHVHIHVPVHVVRQIIHVPYEQIHVTQAHGGGLLPMHYSTAKNLYKDLRRRTNSFINMYVHVHANVHVHT